VGFIFILIYLGIILSVIEINTVLFTLTGLKKQIARFQVISMLTGTGFTTGESELIIEHPLRRRLGAFLILFGAFSLAVIISAITNILSEGFFAMEIAYVAGALFLFLFILKTDMVSTRISKFFRYELKKNYELKDLPIKEVLLSNDQDYFTEFPLHNSSTLIGEKLKEKLSSDSDVNILLIKRGETIIRNNRLNTELQVGDYVVLFGDKDAVRKIFKEELEAHESKEMKEIDQRNML